MADPNTPPIGRQPDKRAVQISGRYPWYGDIRGYSVEGGAQVGGERWTREQVMAIMRLGLDPLTCEAMTVRRQSTPGEWWVGLNALPVVFAFDCPIVQRMKSGRIKVIAPNGDFKFVLPDGWGHRPFRRPRDEHDGYSQSRVLGVGGARSRPSYSTTRRPI
ncbi:hypothetical protein DRN02_005075 [Sphingomonas paucimobilis]|uniref:hypothetical protein n=1 Tax=Sphingomonas paucimobilis TaxID=13689 RepID=UPI000DE39299|nr:hypothetical protein [Sphingomonas paucimobilis]QBE91463.1 hypothetical protein DRN02_005075 [Sphingomonas paucimobilis]